MASGERKKGREQKKPKKTDTKIASKSDYKSRQSEVVASPYFGKRK